MSKVAVVKGTKPSLMVHQALELLNAGSMISTSLRILVKPNCVFPKRPSTGVTTDSRVVGGIIEALKDSGAMEITIGDGGNKNTDKAFAITGMRDLAIKHGLRLVNFNNDEYEITKIPHAKALYDVPISKTVLQSDCIVNVPKLKIHHMTGVTLSMKNLMGVIVGDRGAIMHRQIDDKLVDLAGFVSPKLNVIDGIVGSEMDEVFGHPVQTHVIVAGQNMVSTDAVGCAIMGVNPESVGHLKLAEERGLGTCNLSEVTVLGEEVESLRKEYRRGFTKRRLKEYGHCKNLEYGALRSVWEGVSSNLTQRPRAHRMRSK
jgi:uncharacterized protein (DUF362 family)